MIFIDDAGTGCLLGRSIVVAYSNKTKEFKYEYTTEKYSDITKHCFSLLNKLKVTKEEIIVVCRGHYFKNFILELKEQGYNVKSESIKGETQDIAEKIFLNQLYSFGVDKNITLQGKDYEQLHYDLINEIFIKPKLVKYIKPDFMTKKNITRVLHVIDRLTNEFPNLYNLIRNA